MTPQQLLNYPLSFALYWLFYIGGTIFLIGMVLAGIVCLIDLITHTDKE